MGGRLAVLRGAVIAAACAVAFATGGRAADRAVSWELAGKGLESDARLPALIRILEEEAAESVGRLHDRLGIAPGKAPIRWKVDVSESFPGGSSVDARGVGFFEAGRTAFDGDRVVVSVPARRYLARPAAAAPAVAHEAAHAVMASSLGRDRYEAMPRWFREGIAVWFAGEGKARVDEMIAGSLLEGRPGSAFLSGLPEKGDGEATRDRVTHAEAFLAVLWLERRIGEDGLRALVKAGARGEDVNGRLEEVTGLGLDAARALALDFSRAEVRGRIDAEGERLFGASLGLRDEGRVEDASAAWRSLLSRDPDGPLVPTLLYLLARAGLERTAGEAAAAEAGARLERLLALPDAPWRPEALVLEGERLRAAGDIPGARRAWREVLEAYGDDRVPAGRALQLLEATGGTRR